MQLVTALYLMNESIANTYSFKRPALCSPVVKHITQQNHELDILAKTRAMSVDHDNGLQPVCPHGWLKALAPRSVNHTRSKTAAMAATSAVRNDCMANCWPAAEV